MVIVKTNLHKYSICTCGGPIATCTVWWCFSVIASRGAFGGGEGGHLPPLACFFLPPPPPLGNSSSLMSINIA